MARVGVALAAVAVAGAVRAMLASVGAGVLPFPPFFIAVLISAVYGGGVSGFVATVAGAAVGWLWLAHDGPFGLPPPTAVNLALFVVAGLSIVAGAEAVRHLEGRRLGAESRLDRVLGAVPAGITETDAEGRFVYANPAAARILRLSESEIAGRRFDAPEWRIRDLSGQPLPPDRLPIGRALRGETVTDFEHAIEDRQSGETLILSMSAVPVRDAQGRITGATAAFSDVTERRRVQAALDRREVEFQALAESTPQLVWSTRADGWCDYLSPQWFAYTGAGPEDHFGLGWQTAVHPEDRPHTEGAWAEAVAGRGVYDVEYRLRAADGSYRWFKARGAPVQAPEGELGRWFGVSTDIDDIVQARRLLENRIAAQDRERARIFELSDDLFAMGGFDGYLRLVNPAWTRVTGLLEPDLVGRPFLQLTHPEDVEGAREIARALIRGEDIRSFELRIRTAAGDYRWFSWAAVPEGEIFYIVGRDVTEAKAAEQAIRDANARLTAEIAERRKAETQLVQAQKLEAVGQLTGGIAHDFNNLLQVISGGVELLKGADGEARRDRLLDAIGKAAARGAGLTRQLLTFARRQPLRPERIDVARQVGGMQDLLDRSLRGDVRVSSRFAPDLWPVEVDPAQFELAILNIAVNARDAMPSGGVITISADNRRAGEDGLPGEHVRVAVADTGEGMSPEVLARVFEPFFTTKAVGRGSGLGLSQVYGFAKQAGGDVQIASEPGGGTVVTLLLPRATRAAAEPDDMEAQAPRSAKPLRVLLVEDDDQVAALAAEMLEQLGHAVSRVADAHAGLAAAARSRPDLVVSDILMAGEMNGLELCRTLRRDDPQTPVVLITGYAPALESRPADDPGVRLLPKPFDLRSLAAVIDELQPEPQAVG